jgi:hypothetical protein
MMVVRLMAMDEIDRLRVEFHKRFTGVNGRCRDCGAAPDSQATLIDRAIWYAAHECDPADIEHSARGAK